MAPRRRTPRGEGDGAGSDHDDVLAEPSDFEQPAVRFWIHSPLIVRRAARQVTVMLGKKRDLSISNI
jgi:hypothetical protein